ncbi:hypothetical protein BJ508DRAFT_375577 [Ascobolus immersus RN42]|uniref:Uncharacterized protein n=1 Tax=Ascobolus immersus RN42 TaxID=1160509 RepID=A0A3N4I8Y4_ASCIM|nr:hypothetical protein BJ508DRAFT_375577 [Ascobolus immersus RN42]
MAPFDSLQPQTSSPFEGCITTYTRRSSLIETYRHTERERNGTAITIENHNSWPMIRQKETFKSSTSAPEFGCSWFRPFGIKERPLRFLKPRHTCSTLPEYLETCTPPISPGSHPHPHPQPIYQRLMVTLQHRQTAFDTGSTLTIVLVPRDIATQSRKPYEKARWRGHEPSWMSGKETAKFIYLSGCLRLADLSESRAVGRHTVMHMLLLT